MSEGPERGCPDEDALDAFVRGQSDAEEVARVEAHLATCAACGALIRALAGRSAANAEGKEVPTAPAGTDEGALAKGARFGRYEILEVVGTGGMGVVYAALDSGLDRRVALKLLRREAALTGSEGEARLVREGKAMARLSHPHVVAVYDVGEIDGRVFVAMEFVEGQTLRRWLAGAARARRDVLDALADAGRGLAAVHQAGLVHRDFKPDNVLVRVDGRVLVTDFGLARRERAPALDAALEDTALTQSGAIVGTPAYMAPEQLTGSPGNVRTDVFAFCAVIYEALAGNRPFRSNSLLGLLETMRRGQIPPLPRDVPSRLRSIVVRGLRASPEDRPRSIAEVVEVIDDARLHRRPRGLLLLAAAVVVVVGMAAFRSDLRALARGARAAPSATVVKPACTNRACVEQHGGAPYVCRASDGACVALASEDCTPAFEADDLAAEDTVWVGALFPLKGAAAASHGAMNADGADFARHEIAEATRAFHDRDAAAHVRRVALVTCDDSVDPLRAARHLVSDVGAPAILGFGSGQEVVDVAGSLLLGTKTLAVSTLTASPLITRLPQPANEPRLVVRVNYSGAAMGAAAAAFVPALLERRARGTAPARVVVARVDRPGSAPIGDAFFAALTFNGKSALANGGDYQEVTFADPLGPEAVARTAARIRDASPSIVVLMGNGDPSQLVARIEEMARGAAPPTYVALGSTLAHFTGFLGTVADRRHRLFGVQATSDQTADARFVLRYNEARHADLSRTLNPAASYDGFYLLAYATFALGDAPATGSALSGALPRLMPPGEVVEVGPGGIYDAIDRLARAEAIDLDGASGSLDFDRATGESAHDFALLCAGVDAQGRATPQEIPSGLFVRGESRRLEGVLQCP